MDRNFKVKKAMKEKNKKNLINCLIVLVFLAYLALGIGIYRDYGISSDEPTERISTLVNVKYVLNFFGMDKMSGFDVPDLETYQDRYYGTFLQMPTVIFEVMGHGLSDVYYGRHLWTFLICLTGYLAFFFCLKTIYKSKLTALLGTLMVALYPRFFGEQFYNIKDMVFAATFMVCMFTTVKLIESRFKWNWCFWFAVSAAISTNVRIVGIIFLLLVLGYLLLDFILSKTDRTGIYSRRCEHPLRCAIMLIIIYFALFVVMLPVTWKNPVSGIWEVFSKFSNFDNWDGTIVFMGNVISKEELPWYYVPVWMLISVPVWYLFLGAVAVVIGVSLCVKRIKNKENLLLLLCSRYKYVLWCVLLIAVPWLGIVVMHSTIYNGWRHCYFMLPPLVMFALFGVDYLFRKKRNWVLTIVPVMVIGGILQITWIVHNHPHEMVYFNNVGKWFGEYFDRDYWHLSTKDAVKYIVEHETDDKFSVETPGNKHYKYLLTEEELSRIIDEEEPLYSIETYRGKIGNDLKKDGYEEIYSIYVDDFKICTIFKKVQ